MSLRTRIRIVTLALVAAALPGCIRPVAGTYGLLAFQYHAEDDLFGIPFRDPIAVGAQVDLDVLAGKGTHERLARQRQGDVERYNDVMLQGALPREPSRSTLERASVISALSLPPDVAEVVSTGPGSVRIRALAPGSAVVRVEAEGGSDMIRLEVQAVDHVQLSHWALKDDETLASPVWVKGGTGRFLLSARDAQGRYLLGFGEPPPLGVHPDDAAVVSRAPGDVHHVDVRFAAAGEVTLLPLHSSSVRVRVVEARAITALELHGSKALPASPSPFPELAVGRDLAVHAFGAIGQEKALLLGDVVKIQAGPPTVCTMIPARERAWGKHVLGDGFDGVRGVAPGRCVVEASLSTRTARAEVVVVPAGSRPERP
jgi:hypothetical protein